MALPVGPRMVGFHQDGLEIPARPISEAAPAESWHQCLISSWETNHHHLSSANITITITITNHHHPSSFINHHQPSTSIINHHFLSSADDSAISPNTITNTIINTNKKTNIINKNEFCFFIGWSSHVYCLKHIIPLEIAHLSLPWSMAEKPYLSLFGCSVGCSFVPLWWHLSKSHF